MLTYVEQIPGLVVYGDVTRELEKSHMPMCEAGGRGRH